MRRTASSLVLLAGCQGSDVADTDRDLEQERHAVTGLVRDLDGQPVAGMLVTVSDEFCTPGRTDVEGRFAVQDVAPGPKRLVTYGDTVPDAAIGSVVFPIEVAGDDLSLDEPVLAPRFVESFAIDPASVDPQVVESADGLRLTVAPGSFEPAPFAESVVRVARVPLDLAPPFAPDDVSIRDLFALDPIRSTLDPPAAVQFPADDSLPPGTPVRFYTLDYDLGQLVPVAIGSVDATGRPTSADGEGISELTWVAVALEAS